MKWYHGTTEENMRSIRAVGVRKGTFVSVELADARSFASLRSRWNKQRPVVLTADSPTSKPRLDRSGQAEAVLLADCRRFQIVPCNFAGDCAEPLEDYMRAAVARLFTVHKKRTYDRSLRFPVQRDDAGKRLCRWCQEPVPKGRRSYCSNQCQIEVDVRTSASAARRHVFERDKGVCAECSVDTELLRRVLGYAGLSMANAESYGKRRLYPHFRLHYKPPELYAFAKLLNFQLSGHLWEADHIVELSDGGDGGLDNLQTLCLSCHKRKTAANAGRRATVRRDLRRPLIVLLEHAATL